MILTTSKAAVLALAGLCLFTPSDAFVGQISAGAGMQLRQAHQVRNSCSVLGMSMMEQGSNRRDFLFRGAAMGMGLSSMLTSGTVPVFATSSDELTPKDLQDLQTIFDVHIKQSSAMVGAISMTQTTMKETNNKSEFNPASVIAKIAGYAKELSMVTMPSRTAAAEGIQQLVHVQIDEQFTPLKELPPMQKIAEAKMLLVNQLATSAVLAQKDDTQAALDALEKAKKYAQEAADASKELKAATNQKYKALLKAVPKPAEPSFLDDIGVSTL